MVEHRYEYDEAYDDRITYDDDDGFEDYDETTVDPSPWALTFSILISITFVALIPLCVVVGERLKAKRKKRRELNNKKGGILGEVNGIVSILNAKSSDSDDAIMEQDENVDNKGTAGDVANKEEDVAYFDNLDTAATQPPSTLTGDRTQSLAHPAEVPRTPAFQDQPDISRLTSGPFGDEPPTEIPRTPAFENASQDVSRLTSGPFGEEAPHEIPRTPSVQDSQDVSRLTSGPFGEEPDGADDLLTEADLGTQPVPTPAVAEDKHQEQTGGQEQVAKPKESQEAVRDTNIRQSSSAGGADAPRPSSSSPTRRSRSESPTRRSLISLIMPSSPSRISAAANSPPSSPKPAVVTPNSPKALGLAAEPMRPSSPSLGEDEDEPSSPVVQESPVATAMQDGTVANTPARAPEATQSTPVIPFDETPSGQGGRPVINQENLVTPGRTIPFDESPLNPVSAPSNAAEIFARKQLAGKNDDAASRGSMSTSEELLAALSFESVPKDEHEQGDYHRLGAKPSPGRKKTLQDAFSRDSKEYNDDLNDEGLQFGTGFLTHLFGGTAQQRAHDTESPHTIPGETASLNGSVENSIGSRSSRSSAMSVLSCIAGAVGEYAQGEIYHKRTRDPQRLKGAAQVVKAAIAPNDVPHGDDMGGLMDSDDDLTDEPKSMRQMFRASSIRQYRFYRCDSEMRSIVKLALPFTIHSFAVHVFELMEVAVIGRLIGTDAVSAYIVADVVMSLSSMFMSGALTSLFTLCSQAVGARRYDLAGQYVQIGVLFYQVTLMPFGVLWWYFFEDVVLLFGFKQEVADIASEFFELYFVLFLVGVYTEALFFLLEVTGHEIYTACFTVTGNFVRFIIILVLAKNMEISLRDVGVIFVGVEVVFTTINIIIILYTGWLNDYWAGIVGGFAPSNIPAVKVFMKTSIPLSFGYILSYGEWELQSLFAAFMGPAEVSAWGLLGGIWDAIEEVSLSVADAAEVRVGNLLGAGQPHRARDVAYKALFLGVIVSFVFSIPLFLLRDVIPGLFTTDETLRKMLSDLFPFVCLGNINMMFGSMCFSLLGAQGRYGLATAVEFVGSWLATLPLSALVTIVFDVNLQGLASSVVVGYSCSGAINASFLLRSNWQKLSRKVIKDNAGTEVDKTASLGGDEQQLTEEWMEMDWYELPENVRTAAGLLGYNKKMWDRDLDPPSSDLYWHQLDPPQKEAAATLGYNQEKWDEDSSQDS